MSKSGVWDVNRIQTPPVSWKDFIFHFFPVNISVKKYFFVLRW